ncbi:hypothetical protein [Aliterella atlantica]|uniref:Uncharacterized protein n=1 Tax=Aliterella atlantica CENA595 TaxID=1618023 RepID=A0A0D8ZN55_9CYAN|nr:hypothetical protein [Aliterella atlantica]KJH70233.1 hypothetical protein UH38_18940 [Aliterella atlantica CENA595]
MAVTISESQFKQIKTALANVYGYLDELADSKQEAAEHLAQVEEALFTLQAVEIDAGYSEAVTEGVIKTPGGSWIV